MDCKISLKDFVTEGPSHIVAFLHRPSHMVALPPVVACIVVFGRHVSILNEGIAIFGRPAGILLVRWIGLSSTGSDMSVTPYAIKDAPTTTTTFRAEGWREKRMRWKYYQEIYLQLGGKLENEISAYIFKYTEKKHLV